uniref:Uncharacterized protein n=1 Tax=Timema shepardi TaxID=629360 RepID=A0A7R9AVT3_TIMSH|nr:unnamed protein product [Timema shepardi]
MRTGLYNIQRVVILIRFQVGLGGNGMLYAKEAGRVMVTCEKIDPNWNHNWVQKVYGERRDQTIFKKFFNVIAEPQVGRFKLIDTI